MKMSVDQALRKARSLSAEEAQALYAEMLARFPANKRLRDAAQEAARPKIVSAPADELEKVVSLYQQGRLTIALDAAADLLTRFPNCEILNNIAGAISAGLGRFEQAIRHYDRAIDLAPDYFEALNNRGNALNDHQRTDEAIASFDQAIKLNPNYAEAHMNRGIALRRAKRFEDALAAGTRSIKLNPACAEAYNNRGNALIAIGRLDAALVDFDEAIALRPNFAQALVNRGNALMLMTRLEEALESFDAAIAIDPIHVHAHNNRGGVLRRLKRLDEALESHKRAAKYSSGSALAAAEARNLQAHMCVWSNDAFDAGMTQIGSGEEAFPAFYMLAFEDSPQRQLLCSRNWTAKEYGAGRTVAFPKHPASTRIRLGYFSADFHNHATMMLIARLFELHDRDRFEIHAFSYGPDQQDEMRQRLVANVDAFHQVNGAEDAAIAKLARDKGIDIAIDLKGHTHGSRLGIFAHRAAPVQVTYLGYPGTLGTDFIDYLIADEVIVPTEYRRFYSEEIAYLPNSYQPNDDRREISDRVFTRAELGLPENGFVFACFNNNYKITAAEYDIWARLLRQVEGSVLWLLKDNEWAADNLRREIVARGISADRLVFADRMHPADHLARHVHADLFLDTFMVNAHTTASDALWAGLPVLTKLGRSFVARVAGSLLHAVGLPELVTESPADYERRALEIATDPDMLAALKQKLAANRATAPLFDAPRYTRDIEALYERIAVR
ncbi:tetratricopeptide repeat protein [Sphingomonas crocodyli]|uniref:protein O-GlcNAc transferase n=1 Tax=Sphingomonas crocodyli TaxID=1979270 RepID=A0A437M9H7_9SPHN|nr:tetratricopeptide repeat protein [Sphingomonas crocodyli]RVT94358.1 tetratricopeptide repeat protein [Sphingomonas crocodyli]